MLRRGMRPRVARIRPPAIAPVMSVQTAQQATWSGIRRRIPDSTNPTRSHRTPVRVEFERNYRSMGATYRGQAHRMRSFW